jgi:hypothetical protein
MLAVAHGAAELKLQVGSGSHSGGVRVVLLAQSSGRRCGSASLILTLHDGRSSGRWESGQRRRGLNGVQDLMKR